MTTKTHITIDDVEGAIASEHYFTAADGDDAESSTSVSIGDERGESYAALRLLTFCVLILKNGTKIVGINYGAIDPARHSVEIGRTEARKHAIEQVWPLLGYELRTKLAMRGTCTCGPNDVCSRCSSASAPLAEHAMQPASYQDRVRAEYDELNTKLSKLVAFFGTDTFEALPKEEKDSLTAQHAAMCDHSNCLSERIQAFGQ